MSSAHDTGLRVDVAPAVDATVREEVRALIDAAEAHDTFAPLSDHVLLGLEGPSSPRAVSLLARLGETGRLAGYAAMEQHAGVWTIEAVVHPTMRRDPADVEGALLDAALGEAAARGGAVHVWLRHSHDAGADAMAARGLRPVRELLQLRAPLAPDAARDAGTPPLPVRPFRPGRDEAAWLEVNARAFAGHPEQGSWTLADVERREREPWFDPGGFLLHEIGSRIAAFCWTKVHRNPVLGEIYVIGVDPDFQGRGLGRAMTRAGLGHLATRTVPTAMLYVESTNTAALVLYRSLGFTEHHKEVLYADAATTPPQVDAPTARPIP